MIYKFLILYAIFILFSLPVISQHHIYEYVKESTYLNGEWGRWVDSPDDIGISI